MNECGHSGLVQSKPWGNSSKRFSANIMAEIMAIHVKNARTLAEKWSSEKWTVCRTVKTRERNLKLTKLGHLNIQISHEQIFSQ